MVLGVNILKNVDQLHRDICNGGPRCPAAAILQRPFQGLSQLFDTKPPYAQNSILAVSRPKRNRRDMRVCRVTKADGIHHVLLVQQAGFSGCGNLLVLARSSLGHQGGDLQRVLLSGATQRGVVDVSELTFAQWLSNCPWAKFGASGNLICVGGHLPFSTGLFLGQELRN